MLRSEHLRDLLAGELIPRDRLLVLLAVNVANAKPVNAIKSAARSAGWRGVDRVNVSGVLGRAPTLVVRTDNGWELTSKGREHIAAIVATAKGTVVATVAPTLRTQLATIANIDARAFVEESVRCYEAHLYRAAVVLSWEGAVAVLHDHVVAKHLVDFNAEAVRRTATAKHPWKAAKNTDDLGRMGEHDLLEILTAISVPGLGKNVKEELQKSLKLRNACGHPNSYKLGEHIVAAHIELLILNVFSRF